MPSFSDVQSRVFAVEGKTVYLGGEKITPALRSLLRDQAKGLQTSQLWEVLNASVTNEAYNLALLQSQDFDSVRFAKAMHHWSHFMRNVIHTLSKD